MNKNMKKLLSAALSAAMVAGAIVVPVAYADDYTPIFAGDTVKQEWKLSFGSEDAPAGYTHVPKTAHAVMGDIAEPADPNVEALGLGFIGTYADDFNFTGKRHDGLDMPQGHVTNLSETENGIGSTGSEAGTNGFEYPLRFALNTTDGSYFRVRMELKTLDGTNPAKDVTVWSERKHYVISHETFAAADTKTLEFSVDVEPNYFEKSDPKGETADNQLNIVVAGVNVAVKSMIIQQVNPGTTLWVLGDSTVTDGDSSIPYFELNNFTGVGSGLSKYIRKDIAVSNQGEGGLNAADSLHFDIVKNRIKAGDYMYVEYGHNHKTDGATGYKGNLDKYYNACHSKNATLVIVSPIERINTFSGGAYQHTLQDFATTGKAYVDEKKAAGDIAYIDLNTPSLAFYNKIVTANGGDQNAIKYYFQTSKGAKTDQTHPNDAGAEALAEQIFLNAAAKIAAYPALSGLLTKYDGTTPADDATPSGKTASLISSEFMALGAAGGASWPDAASAYEYPIRIKKVNFDGDGKLLTAEALVQDNNIMPSYGRGIIAVYDKNTNALVNAAISNVEADGDSAAAGYVGWVDNSTGKGTQVLAFDGSSLTYDPETQIMKAFLWSMDDNEAAGYPLTYVPYASDNTGDNGSFVPLEFEYLLTNDSLTGPEQFHFYGMKSGTAIPNNKNGWTISSVTATTNADGTGSDAQWYGTFSSTGTGSMTKTLNASVSEGIVQVEGKIRKTSGTVTVQLIGDTGTVTCFTVDGADVKTSAGTAVDGVTLGNDWTEFTYVLDMNKSQETLTVGEAAPVTAEVAAYKKLLVKDIKPLPITKAKITTSANSAFELTDFTVKAVTRNDSLDAFTMASDYVTDSTAEMGKVTITPASAPQGSQVIYSAANNKGYKFVGWYSDQAGTTSLGATKKLIVKAIGNTTIYAKYDINDGVYYEENFEEATVGAGVAETSNTDGTTAEPVDLGSITVYAGNRNNGAAGDAHAKIAQTTSDTVNSTKYLECTIASTSSSNRGVKFLFNEPIKLSETDADKNIAWEFDTAMYAKSGAGGTTSSVNFLTDIGRVQVDKTGGLNTTNWVKAQIIFDKTGKKQYLVVRSGEKIINVALLNNELKDTVSIDGADFYGTEQYPAETIVKFDNMKIYDIGSTAGNAMVPVDVTFKAPANTSIVVNGQTITTNAGGTAAIKLVEGKYDVVATNADYKTLETEVTVDSTHEVELQMTAGTTSTVKVSYVDSDTSEEISTATINAKQDGAGLFEGDSYTLEDVYKADIHQPVDEGEASFYVYRYDASNTNTTIASLAAGENTMTVKMKKVSDEAYYYYEDFEGSQAPSDWKDNYSILTDSGNKYLGSTAGSNSGNRTTTGSFGDTVKAVDSGILKVSFKMMRSTNAGVADRSVMQFALMSTASSPVSNAAATNTVWDITQSLPAGVSSFSGTPINVNGVSNKTITFNAGTWYDVDIYVDLTNKKLSYKISDGTNDVAEYGLTTTATNVSGFYILAPRGGGNSCIDNVTVSIADSMPVSE